MISMSPTAHWLFFFRFDRRGLTSLWEVNPMGRGEVKDGSGLPAPGVRFEIQQETIVWIEVSTMLPSGSDVEDEIDEAEEQARAFFRQNYPHYDLKP